MEDLIALSKLISKQKVKQIDIVTNENTMSELSKLFYDGLTSGQIKNDLDATNLLYGENELTSKYRKLKRRLRNKLINTVFFIDIQQFSRTDYDKSLVRSYSMLAAVKILRNKGLVTAMLNLAEEVVKTAIKFDIIEVAYFLSCDLAQRFTLLNFDRKKSKYYQKLERELGEIFLLERAAQNCFNYFGYFVNRILDYDINKIPEKVSTDLLQIKMKLEETNAFNFNFQARNALYFKAYVEKDIDQMIKISESSVSYFETKTGFSKIGEFSFLQKLGVAYQANKDYKSTIGIYHKAFNLNPRPGSLSWYNIRFHLFNVNLQLKEYQEAHKYLLEATSHKSFKSLNILNREPWILKEAYMHLLIKMDKVSEDKTSKQRLRPFRLSRFLNEVEHFSKDKRGLNIAVNIIHALFLFLQKKDDDFERRLDALGQYSFRYLRNDDTLRSNAFIKMLQKMPDAGYHPIRLQRHTKKYYTRMIEAPIVIQENSKDVEIIPYEHLWDIVIELLELRMDKKI